MSVTTELPKFTVFPDSCCLFTPNNSQIVSHSFTELFRELKSKCDIQLAIPSIARDELLSQKLFQCEIFLKNAKTALRQIGKLTKSDSIQPPTIEELLERLKQRFDDWIAELDAVVVELPNEIDWPALIDNAVWRRPPFSPRTEADQNTEKGFKDALILETLLAFHKGCQNREIVFVCADGLLSQTATYRLSNQTRFSVETSLEAFGSRVDLLLNKRSEEFSQAVLSKIGSVFYSEHDPDCIWFKFNVLERVHHAMGVRLTGFFGDIYEPRPPTYLRIANFEAVPQPLKPTSEETALIGETRFVTVDNEFYHWRTEVELRQIFGPKQIAATTPTYLLAADRLRKLLANVKWKCKISSELNFTESTVDAIEFVSEKFETPGFTDYVQLRHPRFSVATNPENNAGEEPAQ